MTTIRAFHKVPGKTAAKNRHERGYILITLMLAFAFIAIAALAVLPKLQQQIQRDREDELRHRGTQYMRAIQHYYKFLGRYPTRIEDLENTNNKRFLRKRYKDPMGKDPQTGKERDFKLLHLQDVMLNNGPVLGASATQALGGQAGLSQLAGQQGSSSTDVARWSNTLSGNIESPDPPDPSSSDPSSSTSTQSQTTSTASDSSISTWQSSGGGPFLGVASNSKEKSIHEYNKKNHYNEWYFIYDASAPMATGILEGPWQPALLNTNINLNATNGQSTTQSISQSTSGAPQNQPSVPSQNSTSQPNPTGGAPNNQ